MNCITFHFWCLPNYLLGKKIQFFIPFWFNTIVDALSSYFYLNVLIAMLLFNTKCPVFKEYFCKCKKTTFCAFVCLKFYVFFKVSAFQLFLRILCSTNILNSTMLFDGFLPNTLIGPALGSTSRKQLACE